MSRKSLTEAEAKRETTNEIILCSLCNKTLKQPQTLNCLHSYCGSCVSKLDDHRASDSKSATEPAMKRSLAGAGVDKKAHSAGIIGSGASPSEAYECTKCHQVTPRKEVRCNDMLSKLVDAHSAAKKAKASAQCERCKRKKAQWQCYTCTKYTSLCGECKSNHDDYAAEHLTVTFEDLLLGNEPLQTAVNCLQHPTNVREVFCSDCNDVICVMCKLFGHNGHQAEPLQDKLEHLRSRLDVGRQRIIDNINIAAEDIECIKAAKEDIHVTYKGRELALKKEYEEAMANLQKIHEAKVQKLRQAEVQEVHDSDEQVETKSCRIKAQQQVLLWVDTAKQRANQLLFFRQLHFDGLLEKVERAAREGVSLTHIIAIRQLPWEIAGTAFQQESSITIGHSCPRISILWQHFYLFSLVSQNVLKYNFNRVWVGSLVLNERIQGVYTAVQSAPNEAIVAAQSGLISIDARGAMTPAMNGIGSFSDVCMTSDKRLYAMNNEQRAVQLFMKDTNQWNLTNEIIIPEDLFSHKPLSIISNSIVTKGDVIYVAIGGKNLVVVFDKSGALKQTADVGLRPTVCSIDADGTVLVSSQDGGGCVYTLAANGSRTRLLQIDEPCHAVFQDEKTLWVLTERNALCRCGPVRPRDQQQHQPPPLRSSQAQRSTDRSSKTKCDPGPAMREGGSGVMSDAKSCSGMRAGSGGMPEGGSGRNVVGERQVLAESPDSHDDDDDQFY